MFSKNCVVSWTKDHNWYPFYVDFNHLALITRGLKLSSCHVGARSNLQLFIREILLSASFPRRSEFSFIEQRSLDGGGAQQFGWHWTVEHRHWTLEHLNKWRIIQSASSHWGEHLKSCISMVGRYVQLSSTSACCKSGEGQWVAVELPLLYFFEISTMFGRCTAYCALLTLYHVSRQPLPTTAQTGRVANTEKYK